MKKSRFISALTSVAMTAGLLLSAMSVGVSATEIVEKSSTTVLKLGAEKTSFTMEEVAAGNAKTTVSMYADPFNDDEQITVITGGFGASNDEIKLSAPVYAKNGGLTSQSVKGDPDYEEAGDRFVQAAADPDNKNFTIMGSPKDVIVSEDPKAPIITFDVEFPSNMAAGTYTINFNNEHTKLEAQSGVGGTTIVSYGKSIRSNAKGVDITLGAVDEPTTQPTGDNKIYDGEIKISAEDVEAEDGKEVDVKIYADTNGGTILGLGLKATWDQSAFEIVSAKSGLGFKGAKPTINPEGDGGVTYVLAISADPITNDPSKPIATLTLKPTASAKKGVKYPISFTGTNGSTEVLAQKTKGETTAEDTYYKVVPTNGSVTLKDAGTTAPVGPIYEGTIKIWADKVTADPGEEVDVRIFADTDGGTIDGFELKVLFDKDLTLTNMKSGLGFKGAKPTMNPDGDPYLGKNGATYVVARSGDALTNDPEKPIATLTFKVSENAAPGTVYEITYAGTNGSADVLANKSEADKIYYNVETTPGSITINKAPDTTAATTTEPEPTTVTSIVTVTETSIVTVPSIVTTESVVTVTSQVTVTTEVTVTTVVTVPSIVTTESVVTVTSQVTVTTMVTVTTEVTVTTVITVTSYIPVTQPTTTAATTTAPPATTTQVQISVKVPDKSVVDENSLYWYHADNVEFYRDGIIVLQVGDKEVDVTDKSTVEFSQTPAEVYDGKTFDYEVDFKVKYDGQEVEGKLPVKIGLRGDADAKLGLEKDIGLQDAIRVAQNMLPSGKYKIDVKSFNGYLADCDENDAIDLQDAIAIAKHMLQSRKGKGWSTECIKKYDQLILD